MAKKNKYSRVKSRNQKNRFDIFNGNVNNPGELIFIYSLIGILCIATLIFFAFSSSPKSPNDLLYADVQFSRYEFHKEHLQLFVDGSEQYYSVPAYQETLNDPEAFLSLCISKTVWHIGYTHTPNADDLPFGIKSIADSSGTVYLTPEAIHDYQWGDAPAFYAIFGGMTIVWFVFVLLSIYIGRHPEQFSKRTIRLFFKDGVIRRYKSR